MLQFRITLRNHLIIIIIVLYSLNYCTHIRKFEFLTDVNKINHETMHTRSCERHEVVSIIFYVT
jgi:hypothetical protein